MLNIIYEIILSLVISVALLCFFSALKLKFRQILKRLEGE